MQNSFLLGISVGESFAEYSLLQDSKSIAHKRVYLSRENIKASLSQFVSAHADKKIDHAFVSLKIPRRLLDYHLSGPVGHVTTKGFENWLSLTDTDRKVTHRDFLFPADERVLACGAIENAIKAEDLENIVLKLKEQNCKKVCLHFLHSDKNPANLNVAKDFFESKGLEVFIPAPTSEVTELERWNKNSLNATVMSVFQERQTEVTESLAAALSAEQIFFLDSSGNPHSSAENIGLEGSFAATTALGLAFGQTQKADILHLSLEAFTLITHDKWDNSWKSSYGSVALRHLKMQNLGIQPTLGVHLNIFNHFDFNSHVESWEPGPMFLGRGQKLTLLDLWSENTKLTQLEGIEEKFSAQGIQRSKNNLFALSKTSSLKNTDISQITKELQSLTLQRLALEAFLHRKSNKMIVTGPLASVFGNVFKKDPKTTIQADELGEAHATALWGAQALKGSV